MTLDKFLTARWNNQFAFGLAFIFFSYIALIIFTTPSSLGDSFTGLVVIGCMF